MLYYFTLQLLMVAEITYFHVTSMLVNVSRNQAPWSWPWSLRQTFGRTL